MYFID